MSVDLSKAGELMAVLQQIDLASIDARLEEIAQTQTKLDQERLALASLRAAIQATRAPPKEVAEPLVTPAEQEVIARLTVGPAPRRAMKSPNKRATMIADVRRFLAERSPAAVRDIAEVCGYTYNDIYAVLTGYPQDFVRNYENSRTWELATAPVLPPQDNAPV